MRKMMMVFALMLLALSCFKAPHDGDYDWENPNKVLLEGQVKNILDIPVAKASLVLCPEEECPDTIDVTEQEGHFLAEEIDPGIYTLQITAPSPLYDTITIAACSLKAGSELRNRAYVYRHAVWDMEMEPNLVPRKWTPNLGVWEIVPGGGPEGKVLSLRTQAPPYGGFGRISCGEILENFILEVSVWPLTTNMPSQWWVTLTFCMQDTGRYYFLNLNNTNHVVLGRHDRGVDSTLTVEFRPLTLGTRYRLRVEHSGDLLRAFVDGDQIGNDVRESRYPRGHIGIIALGEYVDRVTYHFDDIVIIPKP